MYEDLYLVIPYEFFYYLFIFFLLGLVFGSFATALIHRIPLGKSWGVSGTHDVNARRSSCPQCKHQLGVKDLIPLFSWVFQGGKCRYCKVSIPIIYPLTELSVASIVSLVYILCGMELATILIMVSVPFLVALTAIDLKFKILPNQLVFIVGGIGALYVGYVFFVGGADIRDQIPFLSDHLLGMLIFPLLLWGIGKLVTFLLKKEALGFGDVKLYAVCGLWVGLAALPQMMILSGVFGVTMGWLWRMVKKDTVFPFGPAIVLALLTLVIGQNMNGEILSLIG